ncbi:hypothetical protein MMC20_001259, partial [Loxospora ochrophaea]|nr:hypothetical protein [Loxospora ochrophaea]
EHTAPVPPSDSPITPLSSYLRFDTSSQITVQDPNDISPSNDPPIRDEDDPTLSGLASFLYPILEEIQREGID